MQKSNHLFLAFPLVVVRMMTTNCGSAVVPASWDSTRQRKDLLVAGRYDYARVAESLGAEKIPMPAPKPVEEAKPTAGQIERQALLVA